MHIRFGYVAMSVILENASPSGTVTFKTFSKIAQKDGEAALARLRRTARQNLLNTLRLLRHSAAYGVRLYRFSSKIVPLATHPVLSGWDYINDLKEELEAVGGYVKENKIRVSFHPDHYTLLNSPGEEILRSSLNDLEHHCRLLDAMALDNRARLTIHVGGAYKNKKNSLDRFKENWARVPEHIAGRIAVENDDKTFTANDVLGLCDALSLPVVLDIHHFRCNNGGESLAEVLPAVSSTWNNTGLPPKFHISSPKSEVDFRSHHDFVNPDDLYPFLMLARELNNDIDIMVEAKQKDRAMFQLVRDLAGRPMVELDGDAALKIL